MGVYIVVIKVGRSIHFVRDALRDDRELLHFYVEFEINVDGQGGPGAKLVCRLQYANAIRHYFEIHGVLRQMNSSCLCFESLRSCLGFKRLDQGLPPLCGLFLSI